MTRWMTVLSLVAVATAGAAEKPVLHHEVEISFDVPGNGVEIVDVVMVPAGVDTLWLDRALTPMEYVVSTDPGAEREPCLCVHVPGERSVSGEFSPVMVRKPEHGDGVLTYQVRYVGTLFESTDDVSFSRENVGREIQATVSEEGIYLAAEGWLPYHPDAMATHRLTIHTPVGWEPVTQGRRTRHEVVGDEQVTVWDATKPADGLILIANRYHVTERDFDGVTSYTFFLEDDPKLVETYQSHTGQYLEMYREMLGPYPYAKFATVENWFPTGYGMPSWTLLGGTVLRLPFIPKTSFGHEIAHNWWGNSSFVDVERGNWCEGLTVYCADYHYKSLESDEAAHEYRRNLLKDFAAYVHDGRDMTLREFKARHSGATRAIGYGKSMMVFHMVDRAIGRDAFLAALRDVWSSHPFQPVSWDDFFAAFAKHGGTDLDWMRDQWLERTGAPLLSLEGAERKDGEVRVTVTQTEPAWELDVPIVLETRSGDVEHVVRLDGPRGEFTFDDPGAVAVHVDPDDHVFRRLHAVEIEPTLSQVLGEEEPRFLASTPAGTEFARTWTETDDPMMAAPGDDADGHARIAVNPAQAELKRWLPEGVQAAGSLLFMEGRRIDLKKNDVVLATADPDQEGVTSLVVLCSDERRVLGLADRVSHYGKYSWLVFPARGRPQRGNWAIAASPLSARLD